MCRCAINKDSDNGHYLNVEKQKTCQFHDKALPIFHTIGYVESKKGGLFLKRPYSLKTPTNAIRDDKKV